jgi:hypothetical protein
MRKLIITIFTSFFLFFPSLASAVPGATYRGDINEDGQVNIFDLLGLLGIIAKGEPGTERQRIIANVDKSADNKVNIFDLLALLRILAGTNKPELIVWGQPEITGLIPSTAASGDTLTIAVENIYSATEVKVILLAQEVNISSFSPGLLKIVVPENFTGGRIFLVAGSDTTGSWFVNARNMRPPVIAGCQIFPADNPWNQAVDAFPVEPNSNNYINNINSSGNSMLHPDFGSNPNYGIPYVAVGGDQPRVPVSFTWPDECDPGPYPIPPNPPIEGGTSSTGDRHVLVLDSTNCLLYETWSSSPAGSGWNCGSGAVFDLKSNALRPDTWTSADAAGLPVLPGLVRYEEVAQGEVNHAIRFTVDRSQRKYIYPATHYASTFTDPNYPPMGLRFRLKASYDISRFRGQSLVIIKALKKYGMIVADNGGNWFITGASSRRWDDNDLEQLKTVPSSAFEVVDASSMVVSGKEDRRNIWPAVSITSPDADTKFAPQADIGIMASAVDYDGSVGLVEFFQGLTKLGEDAAAPYEFTWSVVSPGTYSITARATDNGGAVNTSYGVTIVVGN